MCKDMDGIDKADKGLRSVKKTIDCTILDIYGVKRIPLKGRYSAESLAERLVQEWVPLIECHRKCYRSEYCKYAPKEQHEEILCGVVSDALRNLVGAAFPIVKKLDKKQTQQFLDGAFFYKKFISEAEGTIGMCIESSCVEWFGEFAPMVFGGITRLRGNLNKAASHWRVIHEFHSYQHILLLEGQTEKVFLDEMRKTHFDSYMRLNLEVYEGKGNRTSKRIKMLLDRLTRLGYTIYLQGDKDGSKNDVFEGLVDSGCLPGENVFAFEHDFETAIPSEIIHCALTEMDLIDCTLEEYRQSVEQSRESVSAVLAERFSLDIGPHKKKLAFVTARLIVANDYLENKEFMEKNELGQFLSFIEKIK